MSRQYISNLVELTLNGEAKEKILYQASCEQLKDKTKRMCALAFYMMLFADTPPTLEGIYCYGEGVIIVLSTDETVYQIDWVDGFGVTFAEMFPPENKKSC